MSMHASDYINLASAIGTVTAAVMALLAARDSAKSAKYNRATRDKDEQSKCFEKLLVISKSISEVYNGQSIRVLRDSDRESLIRLICLAHVVILNSCNDPQASFQQKDNFLLMIDPQLCKSIKEQTDGVNVNTNLDFMTGDFDLIYRYRISRDFFREIYTAAH
ncbi:hypothetical protein GTPT_1825 [Tatumella ptyseos ATCC 33301]|uniref:Uncharacterized protein n=2 Tax=Tatumella ptyseos TaxID=82987 RepID=A0A085JGG4_9GAMM|nr:hypothetical protein [Tatumella ptyseos]KFD19560.1 hypothetical protein GTPT_1825 [Tatumella ptyseos ATCC 33301]SQK75442.1 Uncharacterised protein [Tatumella ptyseos]